MVPVLCVKSCSKSRCGLDEMISDEAIGAGDSCQFHARILLIGKPFANTLTIDYCRFMFTGCGDKDMAQVAAKEKLEMPK